MAIQQLHRLLNTLLAVSPKHKSAQHLRSGVYAERAATAFLKRKGLTLVQRNYTTKLGEIDIVMRDGKVWVFVEVRYRQRSDFGTPAASIGQRKQLRLIRTAQCFLQQHPDATLDRCRFDVVSVSPHQRTLTCEWIPNAFYYTQN